MGEIVELICDNKRCMMFGKRQRVTMPSSPNSHVKCPKCGDLGPTAKEYMQTLGSARDSGEKNVLKAMMDLIKK